METIALSIDGTRVTCPAGTSLLEAADNHAIRIPRLCHHPELKPYGACRMCLVEDEKSGRLMAACVTPAASGMAVLTATPRIIRHRRNIVRLMIAEHPESCIVCSKGNRCRLRQAAADLGIGETGLYPMPNARRLESANPFMIRDLSKCILCGKCIRADHELVETGAIDYTMRGFSSRPATAHETGLEQSTCTFCGTCLSMCPTGALSLKNMHFAGSPERELESVCGFCGVGCRLALGSAGGRLVEVNPASRSDTVNGATLCVRGHFAHDFLNSAQRLSGPLLRQSDDSGDIHLVPAAWDETLDYVAGRLSAIRKQYGPQSIGFLGSSKCTNEENYLFQKIARRCLATNHIDNGGRLHGMKATRMLDASLGYPYRVAPLADLEQAAVVLVLGADPDHSAPVVAYHLKRAARKAVPLIVADPRQTGLAPFARCRLPVSPGGDNAMLTALAGALLEKGAGDHAFIEAHTEGFAEFKAKVTRPGFSDLCRAAGLTPDTVRAAADLLAGRKIAFVVGQGILQQPAAAQPLDALLNLALLSGSLGSPHAGIWIVAKENNQNGAVDMGSAPDLLPGRLSVADDAARQHWERQWKTKLPRDPGMDLMQMVAAAEQGRLKALYVMGENPLAALPEKERVHRALSNLELLVVQDVLRNETTAMAHAVLAGAAMAEKRGSFTNLEGRIQCFEPAIHPPGKARADWEILAELHARLEKATPTLERIREEIRQGVPMYAHLDGRAVSWLTPPAADASPAADGKAARMAFRPVVITPPVPEEENYPFTAIVGTQRYHLGSGTRTRASERIAEFTAAGHIEISPADAAALALSAGDTVVVRSARGAVQRAVAITPGLPEGFLFVPGAVGGNDAMNLFALTDDGGWKRCAVSIEKGMTHAAT